MCSANQFAKATPSGWQGSYNLFMQFGWRNVSAAQSANTVAPGAGCTPSASLGDALIENPITSSPINALIKNTSAQSYGAGTASITGPVTSPSADILGQSRASRVDLGAVNFNGSPPPPTLSGPGRLHL